MNEHSSLAEMYAERREKLMEQMGEGLALINSAGSAPDPLLHDKNLYYLTGLTSKKAVLLLAPQPVAIDHWRTIHGPEVGRGRQVREALFVEERDEKQAFMDGAGDTFDDIRARTGVPAVYNLSELNGFLARILPKQKLLWLNTPGAPPLDGPLPPEIAAINAIRERYWWLRYLNIAPLIHDMRWVKEPYEIDCLRRAFAIHADIYRKMMPLLKPGVNEALGHAFFEHELRLQPPEITFGLDDYDASIIVASGKNTAVAHYMDNNCEIQDGDLVLLDAGVICSGYSSDITTTFPANGHFSPRQRELYTVVLEAHKKAIATMKPGSTQLAAHKAVYDHFDAHGLAQYNYGNCGHPVGLNIHDANGEQDRPLEPGVVLVIEPFLAIPEEGIGIRIESGVLITEDGCELLPDAPKEIDEIEALCA